MMKIKFKKNHTYYLNPEGWKLKFIEENRDRAFCFKILKHDDPIDNWIEYETRDGSEIVKEKKDLRRDAKPL